MNTKIEIPSHIKTVIEYLKSCGFEVFCVGGCVRDSILNTIPYDWDLCTNAKPYEMIEIFKNKFKFYDTGIKHGTISVIINKKVVEVTTYRSESTYNDSRHPDEVKFISSIFEDLKRRDFTMNSIAYSDEKGIVDPFFGLNDIKNRIIRCVGDPYERFNEDALRIMRALRFSSVLDFKIEENTMAAIKALYKNLDIISNERIEAELSKLLIGKTAGDIITEYSEVFEYIFRLNLSSEFILSVNKLPKFLDVRLGVLLHNHSGNKIKASLSFLKFPAKTIKNVICITEILNHKDFNKKIIKYMLSKYEEEIVNLGLTAYDIINNTKHTETLDEILKNRECYSVKQLRISGNDLKNMGFDGKKTGAILNDILQNVIDERLNNDYDSIIKYIEKNY